MLFAQLSDTHIAPKGQKTCGVAPMAENLAACVEAINALQPRPDLVLHTGDVTHTGTKAEALHAAEILSALVMPLHIVPGNHDDRRVLAAVFGPKVCPVSEAGHVNYVIEGYPLRIIALDTLDPGKPGGALVPGTLQWLNDRLGEASDRPTVICAHHPPLRLGVPESDEDGFEGARTLGEVIDSYCHVERFLCGHIHLHTNTRWRGTLVTTAPSPGMQLTLDLTQETASQFLLSDPAFLLHFLGTDPALVTHPINLRDLDGPFEFTV